MDIGELVSKNLRSVPQRGLEFENADYPFFMTNKDYYHQTLDALLESIKNKEFDYVVGMEATGLPIAGAIAYEKNAGLVMIRKFGKLPGEVIVSDPFFLPYKKNEVQLEIQKDIVLNNMKVLLFDEAIDTGSTLISAVSLLQKAGANNIQILTITNLPKIKQINGFELNSLIYGTY